MTAPVEGSGMESEEENELMEKIDMQMNFAEDIDDVLLPDALEYYLGLSADYFDDGADSEDDLGDGSDGDSDPGDDEKGKKDQDKGGKKKGGKKADKKDEEGGDG